MDGFFIIVFFAVGIFIINISCDSADEAYAALLYVGISGAFFSGFYFSYSVLETVILGRYLHMPHFFGKPTEKDVAIAEDALRKVGMEKLSDRQIGSLSGGELQRVFLARTFAQESNILFLDEPGNIFGQPYH